MAHNERPTTTRRRNLIRAGATAAAIILSGGTSHSTQEKQVQQYGIEYSFGPLLQKYHDVQKIQTPAGRRALATIGDAIRKKGAYVGARVREADEATIAARAREMDEALSKVNPAITRALMHPTVAE